MRARVALLSVALAACGGATPPPVTGAPSNAERERQQVADFAALEVQVLERAAASDPRVALRLGVVPSKATLSRIETDGVLAEDSRTALRGASVDLFAFGARARTLADAEKLLAASPAALPETGAALARPRLERELLARLIDEEKARIAEESPLDDGAGPLVRGVVATWAPGSTAWEWRERDEWVARRLIEVRGSLARGKARAAPSDLEPALFELEKLLVPMQFPRGVAALTTLHEALDADDRPDLPVMPPDMLAQRMRAHLGVAMPPAQLASLIERTRAWAASALPAESDAARDATNAKARELVFEAARCPAVVGSPLRSAAPPDERVAVCGVIRLVERAVGAGSDRAPALVALHDLLVVAGWTLAAPTAHARIATLSFRVDDELADTAKQLAAARPLVALAAGYAAAMLLSSPADAAARVRAWLAFGEAPLDLVERELARAAPTLSASSPSPASPRP